MNPAIMNPSGPLLPFLETPDSYPHRPAAVRSTETHISWVFFASPFVYKVKKPVNLGFLDFSTLAKRRRFCEREVDLNRRLCPEVYLGVRPIYETTRGLSFEDSSGKIIEYAVKMRELPHGWFLKDLLDKGAVGEREIDRLIARLRSFYDSEIPTPQIEGWGRPKKLKISTEENFEQVRPFVGRTVSAVAFDTIRVFTNGFYAANERLFEERIRQERIRDCHGDLHLDHVHITPEAVTIFDCIEFNDRFRFIDIANDLAFLAMDFDFEREHKLGALFLRHAARELGDPGLLKLAEFYKCYRAFLRGKVESLQMKSEEHATRARRYFQLALRYATLGSGPSLVVVMGGVATGKSTVARALGTELSWPVFSSDSIRKSLAGVPLTKRTEPDLRRRLYSEGATEETYQKLIAEGLGALARPGGAVLDATFSSRAKRDLLRRESGKAGVAVQWIELQAERGAIRERLRGRTKSATEVSDARLEDLEMLSTRYEPPSELAHELIEVSTGGALSETPAAVLSSLARRRSTAG
ncbi:MAG: AAA family ATPase [Chthoniobacterales bacterium]